jgi:hypothetical protein
MSFNRIASEGIRKIYEEDLENQIYFLTEICQTVRNMHDISSLLRAKAFFVRSREFMRDFFGEEITSAEYDVYSWDGICYWDHFIVFPITSVGGSIVGFAGFDMLTKAKQMDGLDALTNTYRYSSKSVFNRSKYLYCLDGIYEKAIKDGYLIVVDGIYDMLSFNNWGINSASMLGSSVTESLVFQLLFIKNVYVAGDNDSAGSRLYNDLRKVHKGVRYIRQNRVKDSDDMLKSDYGQVYVKKVLEAINNKEDLSLRLKPVWSSYGNYNHMENKESSRHIVGGS